MPTTSDFVPNLSSRAVAHKDKIKRRKIICRTILETVLVYIAVVAGVLMTESALDIRETQVVSFFTTWSWTRFGISALIAGAFMMKFESGGDRIGKKRNMMRRVSHAFGQGAALRGAIEWFALLFTLTR